MNDLALNNILHICVHLMQKHAQYLYQLTSKIKKKLSLLQLYPKKYAPLVLLY